LAREYDIHVVPLQITLNGRAYREGIDITANELYSRLRSNGLVPTTSAPSVGDFLRVYATVGRMVPNILSVHLSTSLSATYDTAVVASRLVDDVTIRVLECPTAAMGQGFAALEAARAAATGADLDTVVAQAQQVGSKANVLAIIATMKYLRLGGRIGAAAWLLGTILKIKPILYIGDGKVGLFANSRTKGKAIKLILEHIAKRADGRSIHAAILHADVPEEAEALRQQVAGRFDCAELFVTEFTPVMGTHAGPGLLGVAFYVE
jgi:DegV family protein with EDD domain